MNRSSIASALALVCGLAVLVLFPLPFWFGIEVLHWTGRWQIGLLAVVATAIALLAVHVVVRVRNALAPPPPPWRHGPTREETAAAHAADLLRIGADPALAHWLPLARRMLRFDAATVARYETRYRQLRSQPQREVYAQALLDGNWIGDREIDYRERPELVVTCAHLQAIERDLRRHGIRCIPGEHRDLWTAAWLDLRELHLRYALHDGVQQIHQEDHPHSPGNVYIRCTSCGSQIESGGSERLPAAEQEAQRALP